MNAGAKQRKRTSLNGNGIKTRKIKPSIKLTRNEKLDAARFCFGI